MTELPDFSRNLLESAKFFLHQGKNEQVSVRKQAFLRASLYHSLAYVEAQVNDIAAHFIKSKTFSVHQLSMLLENDIALVKGRFEMINKRKIARLTDRIDILAAHFAKGPPVLSQYDVLKDALKSRNSLSHPKGDVELTDAEVGAAIEASVSVCSQLAKFIFLKDLPYVDRGLDPASDYT